MGLKRLKLIILFINTCITFGISAQDLPLSITQKIDSIFGEWNNPNTPGCAIGIVRNDSLIYTRGYGMANLEHDIPITPETIFYMASVSKQFTGYAIVLLAKEGKLQLDDDIRIYLPWIPDFRSKITIRQLLNHTSGLRDDLSLAQYGGLAGDGYMTQELAINYIKHSTGLNFAPGEKYSYSNSNYILLAEIVKKTSGKAFKDYVSAVIFNPLGMNQSLFADQPNLLIKNRAVSYAKTGAALYFNLFHNVYTVGDGGMFSNIRDMAKWVMNFYQFKAGDEKDIRQLVEKGRLNNGNQLNYALGISVSKYKGFDQYTHSGGLAGYRTNIAVFPDLKLGFIAFGNIAGFNSIAKTNALADLFLKNYSGGDNSAAQVIDSSKARLKDTLRAKRISGNYIGDDGLRFSFRVREQKLYWERYGQSDLLVESGKDSFLLAKDNQVKFVTEYTNRDTIIHQYTIPYDRRLVKYNEGFALPENQLKYYSGIYYSPELDLRLEIIFKDNHLKMNSFKDGEFKLKVIGPDDMYIENEGTHLRFLRDKKSVPSGFEMNDGRILHVRFDRIN